LLIYVFDAYCGWSHGFSGTLQQVAARHPDLPVEVVSGGLFTGARRRPIRELGYVSDANATISEMTGAEFGDGYRRRIADGSFVMDSEADFRRAARLGVEAFPTLLTDDGDRAVVLARGHATADAVDQRLAALAR
jgi:putative protein-disulfide isomerase